VRVVEGEKVIKVPEIVKKGIKDVCVLLLRGRPGWGGAGWTCAGYWHRHRNSNQARTRPL
jgi:hypothetical protein